MSYTLLVVEDEFDVRENIVEILTANSYRVLSASNGREAVKQLLEEIPDLIVSDITMPVMDGIELLEFTQSSKNYSHIPFVFLTAKTSTSDWRKGMTMGADDYLTKPFKASELLSMIEIRLKKKEYITEQFQDIKENIALSIPHELRTPLTPILGYSEMMLEYSKSISQNEIEEMGLAIKESALRLRTTVEKFIQFSNIHVELNNLKRNETLLSSITDNIEDLIKKEINDASEKNKKGEKINLEIEESRLKIVGQYFHICVKELIENAYKFSTSSAKIKITGENKIDFYELIVENNSNGLTSEQIKKINLFNKLEDPTYTGSGLGLPIVKKIIDFFGGKLGIECKNERLIKIAIQIPISDK